MARLACCTTDLISSLAHTLRVLLYLHTLNSRCPQGQDFHRDAAQLAEQVIPQHNYRLDAAALAGRHYGQVSCRDFRTSVLRSMPHRCCPRWFLHIPLSDCT